MAKLILGIHGLANKPPKKEHEQRWRDSISEGLKINCKMANPAFDFALVYWADLLYKLPNHSDPDFTFDSLYDAEPYLPAKPGALKKYKDNWADSLRAGAQDLLDGPLDTLKAHLGMDAISDMLLGRIVRDLAFYYDTKRTIKDRQGNHRVASAVLQDELESALVKHKDNTILLLAHSMGTIISYDVLRKLGKTRNDVGVSHLVTIGSPLGLPTVKARLNDVHKKDVRTPTIVQKSWVNFADKEDPVAFDTHLRGDFKENAGKVRVVDDLILNDYHDPSGKRKPHKIYGYLRAPEVSEHIQSFLA